jgi:DNA polymerase III delta prime subunit
MLHQTYQPKTWSDYVGQPKAVKAVRRIIERPGFDRGVFWIEAAGANNSGVGKSALANLIASQLADPFFVTHLSGAKCDKAAVEDMARAARLSVWGDGSKPFRVWIIDEAHAMTAGAVDLMLTFLEALPRHSCVIFTTTRRVDADLFGDHDSGPFASRCFQVTLTNQGLAQAFAERAKQIAVAEGLDGQDIAEYVKRVKYRKNNMRAVLQDIQAGAMMED